MVYYKIIIFIILLLFKEIRLIFVFPFSISRPVPTSKRYYTLNDFLSDSLHIDFYTSLFIGEDNIKILARISTENSTFILSEEECSRQSLDSIYDNAIVSRGVYYLNQSSTYKNISKFENILNNYNKGGIITEILSFYNTTYLTCQATTLPRGNFINENKYVDNKITLSETKIIIKRYTNNKVCGLIGLGSPYIQLNEGVHIINELKRTGVINNYSWTFNFMTKSEGQLIIGGLPHEYMDSKLYKENQFIEIKTNEPTNNNYPWSMYINEIYFENEKNQKISVEKDIKGILLSNFGFIIGTSAYKKIIYEEYFEYLFNENICEIEKSKNLQNFNYQFKEFKTGVFEVFSCSKDIVFQKKYQKYIFPNLLFQQNDLNYTFFLDFNSLFLEIRNKYYFLVLFPENSETSLEKYWYIGLPFLKKYQFVYNYDSKTIGFYNSNIKEKIKNKPNNNGEKMINTNLSGYSIKRVVVEVIIIVILLLIAYTIGKKINEHRKNRANELKDDNYEYFGSDINSDNKNKIKNIKSKYKEIMSKNDENKSLEMSLSIGI